MDLISHSGTPKSPTFGPNRKAGPDHRCAASAAQLSEAFYRITSQCMVDLRLINPSVIRTLALIRKEVSNAFYLTSERCRGISKLPGIIGTGTKVDDALDLLADQFDHQKEKVETWMYKFIPHVLEAKKLTRLLGPEVEDVNNGLESDLHSLSSIVRAVTDADNAFTSKWTEALESRPEGVHAYSTTLKKHWNAQKFKMNPSLSEDTLDPSTILHCDLPMEQLGREWTSQLIAQSQGPVAEILRSVGADIRQVASELKLPVTKAELADANLPVGTLKTWAMIMRDLQVDLRTEPLRVCCFGSVNHGKSSLINALIGKGVLEPGREYLRGK